MIGASRQGSRGEPFALPATTAKVIVNMAICLETKPTASPTKLTVMLNGAAAGSALAPAAAAFAAATMATATAAFVAAAAAASKVIAAGGTATIIAVPG